MYCNVRSQPDSYTRVCWGLQNISEITNQTQQKDCEDRSEYTECHDFT